MLGLENSYRLSTPLLPHRLAATATAHTRVWGKFRVVVMVWSQT